MTATLLVTVDTEEEGLWGGKYRPTGNTTENLRGIARFRQLCDKFAIRPTYLVDAPVLENAEAVDTLRAIQDDNRGEIGAHVHPWCNPPLQEQCDSHSSFLCNLPKDLQRDKIAWLTERIEEQFGRRPTSFRAGRYGLDIVGARLLSDLAYTVDSSVIPFTDYSADGGPDFRRAPQSPYLVGSTDLCTPCESGDLVEVPVSVGYSSPNFERADALRNFAMQPALRRMRAVGILDRLGIARRIKLSPEQADARLMKQLINAYQSRRATAIVMMFHSTSLLPGFSPYVHTNNDLEQFYSRLEETFEFCLAKCNMQASTLTGFARQFLPATVPA